jgi:hypothetical protein
MLYFPAAIRAAARQGASSSRSGGPTGAMRWPWRPWALPLLRPGRLGSGFGSPLENGEAWRLTVRWDSSSAASSSFIRWDWALIVVRSLLRSSSWSSATVWRKWATMPSSSADPREWRAAQVRGQVLVGLDGEAHAVEGRTLYDVRRVDVGEHGAGARDAGERPPPVPAHHLRYPPGTPRAPTWRMRRSISSRG